MDLGYFTDPRFLALLRFWEAERGGRAVPVWRDDTAASFPAEIAPWLVAARYEGSVGTYLYVGAECVRRFGADATGMRTDEFLAGGMLRYVSDMARAAREHEAPVFSYCLYGVPGEESIRTARVFAPFAPSVVLSLQLFEPTRASLARYTREGRFEELVRKRILSGGEALRKLEQAARFHRLGRAVHVTQLADELVAAARDFDAEATVVLPVLRDDEAGEGRSAREAPSR
jgi:hypothetical protein